MVREAEEYADEDKKVKERIDARNGLESYLYNAASVIWWRHLDAIDATPARRRGRVGLSRRDSASTVASSPRNDLVKNCRVHPTHWLISTQAGAEPPRRGRARAPRGRHGSHARARRRDPRGVHARAARRDRAARAAARQTSSAAARGPAHLRRREESRGVIWLFCGFFSSVRAPRARSGLPLAELASSLATCLSCRRSLEESTAPATRSRAEITSGCKTLGIPAAWCTNLLCA